MNSRSKVTFSDTDETELLQNLIQTTGRIVFRILERGPTLFLKSKCHKGLDLGKGWVPFLKL